MEHSTWGEENLMSLDEMDRFISNDTVSLCVKFEIQESIIDALPEIVNPFNKLVNSPKFSDITFRVTDDYGRDKLFYAHKGILASSSPVFEAMLTNGMRETFEDEIHLSQTNHSAFLALLTFIYTFKVNNTSLNNAENLLALADKFAIIPVREECLRYFRLEMNTENVWGIWAIAANVTSEEKIYELVVRWANYSCTNDSSSKLSTRKTSSKSIKVDALSSTPSSSSSASMLSELPKDAGDSSDRLAALPSLLKCVRFPVMQKRYIVEKVEGNATVMSAEIMKDL
ncbi:8625_t:CDS:2, partial [Racocetra fulgida]